LLEAVEVLPGVIESVGVVDAEAVDLPLRHELEDERVGVGRMEQGGESKMLIPLCGLPPEVWRNINAAPAMTEPAAARVRNTR